MAAFSATRAGHARITRNTRVAASVRHAGWLLSALARDLQGVANRDLKLENLLLDREEGPGNRPLLKICDFGYSKHEMNSSAKTNVGTPIYMAPEIVYGSNRYNAKVVHPPSPSSLPPGSGAFCGSDPLIWQASP